MGLVAIKYLISERYDLLLVTDVIDVCQKGSYVLVGMARVRRVHLMTGTDQGLHVSSQPFREPPPSPACSKQRGARPHLDLSSPSPASWGPHQSV